MLKTRRKFLKESAGITVAYCSLGAVALLQGCTSVRYLNATQEDGKLIVGKEKFGEDAVVLVNHHILEAPVYLRKTGDGGYHALLLLCMHKACTVIPEGAILVCPCHGSEYSSQGIVLKGPARDNLIELEVTEDNARIYINISLL